jgi:hypothetical protein
VGAGYESFWIEDSFYRNLGEFLWFFEVENRMAAHGNKVLNFIYEIDILLWIHRFCPMSNMKTMLNIILHLVNEISRKI